MTVTLVAVAYVLAPRKPADDANPPTAMAPDEGEPPAPTPGVAPPTERRAPGGHATASNDPRPKPGPAAAARDDDALLTGFLASRSAWNDWYWTYRPTESDLAAGNELLEDARLVGDGTKKDVRYPPPVFGFSAFGGGAGGDDERTAILSLYCAGKGLALDALKKEFGPPRVEEQIETTVYVVYGLTGVLYDADGTFLGVTRFSPLTTGAQATVAAGDAGSPPGPSDRGDTVTLATTTPPPRELVVEDATDKHDGDDATNGTADFGDSTTSGDGDGASATAGSAGDDGGPAGGDANTGSRRYCLKFAVIPAHDHPYFSVSTTRAELVSTAIPSVSRPPRSNAPVMYATFRVVGRDVAAGFSTGPTPLLYVDADADGDLAEEKALRGVPVPSGSSSSSRREFRFGPVAITEKGRELTQVCFRTEWSGQRMGLAIHAAGAYQGKISLGAREYTVAVLDGDLNGRFNEVVSVDSDRQGPRDHFAIDRNGNRRIDAYWSELQPLSELVRIEDSYYSIKVEPDGTAIEIARVEPPMGTLSIGTPDAELMLASDKVILYLSGSKGSWEIPAGAYRCYGVNLIKQDGPRTQHVLAGHGIAGKLRRFQIDAGDTLTIPIGPPLDVKPSVQNAKAGASQRIVYVGLTISDKAGVSYYPGVRTNGRLLSAPSLRILDRSGKVLATGKFEYG